MGPQHSPAALELVHRTFGGFSRVGTEPFLDPADFGWTALLEQHYPAIRAEAERVRGCAMHSRTSKTSPPTR